VSCARNHVDVLAPGLVPCAVGHERNDYSEQGAPSFRRTDNAFVNGSQLLPGIVRAMPPNFCGLTETSLGIPEAYRPSETQPTAGETKRGDAGRTANKNNAEFA